MYGLGLIGQEQSGEYLTYHFDLRGSTVALTDGNAQVTSPFQYSPYGLLISGDASTTPFLFNGMYGVMTDNNGLYYMRARYYNPEIRRFVNQDILLGNIFDGQTLNRYAYVTGQPMSYVDPFGLEKRPLTPEEKKIVVRAINRLKEYGFVGEANDLMRLLEQGSIRIDTELFFDTSKHYGEASKFFECFNLAPELFQANFDYIIVPVIAHEYAHILDWRSIIFPMDKIFFHGITFGYFAEDFPEYIEELIRNLAFERNQEKQRRERQK